MRRLPLDGWKQRHGTHAQGVFGRKAGGVAGFRYSRAMRAAGIV